jgi:hypothetical protein
MAKSKKANDKKLTAKRRLIAKWDAQLKELGLPEIKPGFLPRRRRVEPLLDKDGNELERAAQLNLDGSAFIAPEDTEYRLAVTPHAFLKLAEHFKLSGVARTVLAMRLLLDDCTRETVRAYFLREHPDQISEAMSAWRRFNQRIQEIRAFLEGYRQDCEVPAKPRYRLSE